MYTNQQFCLAQYFFSPNHTAFTPSFLFLLYQHNTGGLRKLVKVSIVLKSLRGTMSSGWGWNWRWEAGGFAHVWDDPVHCRETSWMKCVLLLASSLEGSHQGCFVVVRQGSQNRNFRRCKQVPLVTLQLTSGIRYHHILPWCKRFKYCGLRCPPLVVPDASNISQLESWTWPCCSRLLVLLHMTSSFRCEVWQERPNP